MTVFNYNCDCSYSGTLQKSKKSYICPNCEKEWRNDDGIIVFTDEKSNQTDIYDDVYSAGYSSIDQKNIKSQTDTYKTNKELAYLYFDALGYDLKNKTENLSILDAACGIGWTTAALYCNERLLNSKIHAFDISISGIKLLNAYLKSQKINNKNQIELSVQDAMDMKFSANSFDVIMGSSILHHFDHYDKYIEACFDILKPSGKAIFGEPFAIGYGIVYSVMKVVSSQMWHHNKSIEDMYIDTSVRIQKSNDNDYLKNLVDKHLFLPDELLTLGRNIGFKKVEIKPLNNIEYIKNGLIPELYENMGITKKKLIKKTLQTYKIFFDMFNSNVTYNRTISPFNYVIFIK